MSTPKETDHLWTPQWIIELAVEFMGEIGLDPAWNEGSPVRARVTWTAEDDSLRDGMNWAASSKLGDARPGTIWLNPPYSEPYPFLARMSAATQGDAHGLALVKHDHSTRWWRDHCAHRPICMLHKRPKFGGSKGPGTFPSTVVWFASRGVYQSAMAQRFFETFDEVGEVRQ